jgi:hypothetical protein
MRTTAGDVNTNDLVGRRLAAISALYLDEATADIHFLVPQKDQADGPKVYFYNICKNYYWSLVLKGGFNILTAKTSNIKSVYLFFLI